MYAVIETGGKQYRVSVGDVIEVEKLSAAEGDKVELPVIMLADDSGVKAGADVSAKAEAEVLGQGKGRKIVVFKYKAKKNERKKQGHRQQFSRIKIVNIA